MIRSYAFLSFMTILAIGCASRRGHDTVAGMIRGIDPSTKTILFVPEGKSAPVPVQWSAKTEFIQNNQYVPGEFLEAGHRAILRVLRGPDGKPLVTAVFWEVRSGCT